MRIVKHYFGLIILAFLMPLVLNAQWNQVGNDINGDSIGDQLGYSVSLSSDGQIMAVGSPARGIGGNSLSYVSIYEYDGTNWIQLGTNINGEFIGDRFGSSISLSDDGLTIAIGADENDGLNGVNSGHTRVYEYNGSNWIQLGNDIDGESVGDRSGSSVSLSSNGGILAIGARENSNANGLLSGQVRVYQYDLIISDWVQLGSDIDGEDDLDELGLSVSLSSDGLTLAAGARLNDGNGNNSGHARVYQYDMGVSDWVQFGGDFDGAATGDRFGTSVSLSSDGLTIAIGAISNDGNGSESGHVKIYNFNLGVWTQIGNDIEGEGTQDGSGISVSLSANGRIVAVGAWRNDGGGIFSGHVRVHRFNGVLWIQEGNDIDGEAAFDFFGASVSLSSDGSTVVGGAEGNDDNGNNSGQVRVYSNSSLVGIDERYNDTGISIFPNPNNGEFTLLLTKAIKGKMELFNMTGQLVKTQSLNQEQNVRLNFQDLKKGIYFFHINSMESEKITKLVVN